MTRIPIWAAAWAGIFGAALLAPALAQAPAQPPAPSANPARAGAAAGAPPAAAPAAVEAQLRRMFAERFPKVRIDEINRAPIAGLWEVRYDGAEILYADGSGEFIVVHGSIVETRTRTDLTQQRIDRLLAVDWSKLPLKDSIVARQGNGQRRLAVFADPNCSFCKVYERDLAQLKDVTIHVFVMPILGPDSSAKARDVWCSREPLKAWRAWMLDGEVPPKAMGACDTRAIERVLAFASAHRITSTPVTLFEDGSRRVGAVPPEDMARLLATAARKP